MYNVYVSFTIA